MLCSPLQPTWDLTIHSLCGSTSSLALVPLFNQCEILLSTPFEAQRPHWHSFLSLGSHNPPSSEPSEPSILVGPPLGVHPFWGSTSLLAYRSVSTSFGAQRLIDVGCHIICALLVQLREGPNYRLTNILVFLRVQRIVVLHGPQRTGNTSLCKPLPQKLTKLDIYRGLLIPIAPIFVPCY